MKDEIIPYQARTQRLVDLSAPSLLQIYSGKGSSASFGSIFDQCDVREFYENEPALWRNFICVYEKHQTYLNQSIAFAKMLPHHSAQQELRYFQWGPNPKSSYQLCTARFGHRFLSPGFWKHFNLDTAGSVYGHPGSAYVDATGEPQAIKAVVKGDIEVRTSIFIRATLLAEYARFRNLSVLMHCRTDRHAHEDLSHFGKEEHFSVTRNGDSYNYELEFYSLSHQQRPMTKSWSSIIGKKDYTPYLRSISSSLE